MENSETTEPSPRTRRARRSITGFTLGCGLVLVATVVGGRAVAQQPSAAIGGVLEASHLPPLLTLPGAPVRLSYDVHCALPGVDSEQNCDVRGTVFIRTDRHTPFRSLALAAASVDGLHRLTADVPPTTSAQGFEYYAMLEAPSAAEPLVVPSGGSDAPHRSLRLSNPVDVTLGKHAFGATARGSRIASVRWGDGPIDAGLEPGRSVSPIGASAFEVGSDGTVLLLDQAHRRILRWEPEDARPTRIPVSIQGRLADLTLDENGSIYVLETTSLPGRAPLVRRFDDAGRELDVAETAERAPSQIRPGPKGPVVLQHPSHQWMPVSLDGTPASPNQQRAHGRSGRPLPRGGEIVLLRQERETLVAIVANDRVQHAWRITSGTPLAEVQLADRQGQRLVLVARVYDDSRDEFVVLVLDRGGVARRFAVASSEWAESAPLSRFRLVNGSLYRLGSSQEGPFVDRFDLEMR